MNKRLSEVLHKSTLRSTTTNNDEHMSTTNPRVSVTLKPKTAAILRRLSAVTGNSVSSIIADLLEDSEPVYERTVRTLEAARAAVEQARAEVVKGQREDQRNIHEKFYGLKEADFQQIEVDERQQDLLASAETVRRRARRAAQPPSLTGGSQTPNSRSKSTAKSAAKPRQQRKGGKNGPV